MKANRCKCCKSENLKVLIDLGIQPVAHNLLEYKEQEDAVKNKLCLHYCESCGFIQISNPISPELLYTKYNYCFSEWKAQPHIPEEIEMLVRNINQRDIKVLEIGCNDGVFLKPLQEAGFHNIVGIEANPYASTKAEALGFEILNLMFDKRSAGKLKEKCDYFDLVVLRQVLEHIPDLDDLFDALESVLGGERLLFIEVPDFSKALQYGDCSTIWEEHPNYFTYEVLEYMLGKKGYQILERAFYDFSGGAMSVLAKKTDYSVICKPKGDRQQYAAFADVVADYAAQLKLALKGIHEEGEKVFLYGTGARACTLVNGLNLGQYIDCAIDDQKEKQNHFMPGCRLPITSLNEALKLSPGGVLFVGCKS